MDLDLAERALDVDIVDLTARASKIEDPTLRGIVMDQIIDLAKLTSDGRPSFKGKPGQKWKHGFIPVNEKAQVAKAKGSPIAMKRMKRLFGNKGRVSVGDRQSGDTSNATTASRVAGVKVTDIKRSNRVKNAQFEKNKVGRNQARAQQNWDKIPPEAKTVRNGKRFVIATFGGRQVLTEWHGGSREIDAKNTTRQASLTTADAANLSSAQLRKILKDPKAGKAAKQKAYQALKQTLVQKGRAA